MTRPTLEFMALADPEPWRAPRVLWIDHDAFAVQAGVKILLRHGFEVDVASSEAQARARVAGPWDLVILDTALPGADGLALCHTLSETVAPVLVVSAAATTLERVAALEFGADDFLPKTTHPLELLARARVLIRRSAGRRAAEGPRSSPWRFDLGLSCLTAPSGRMVWLAAAEAALLRILAERPGELLQRNAIVEMLHGGGATASPRSIDVRIARLRIALLPCDNAGELIKTLRGGGYLLPPRCSLRPGHGAPRPQQPAPLR